MTADRTALIDRIRKILALGERGGTEAEAQTAMAHAHRLLAKYNLSMSDITVEAESPVITDESTPSKLSYTYWSDVIYASVAELNFCTCFVRKINRNGKNVRIICFVGREENIAVTKEVSAYLLKTGDRLAQKGSKGMEMAWRWAGSFRIGYASRISHRIQADIRAAKAGTLHDSDTGTALMLASLYTRETQAILRHMAIIDLHLTRKYRSSSSVQSWDGYSAGKAAGDRVNYRGNGLVDRNQAAIS